MSRTSYIALFIFALLMTCASAYAASRLFLPPGQEEQRTQPAWTPPGTPAPTSAATRTAAVALSTSTPVRTSPSAVTSPTILSTPAPLPTLTPQRERQQSPTPTSGSNPTATMPAPIAPTPSASQYPYQLARAVRDSVGDCPGSYILGQVRDRLGNLLPGVSLRLVDEFGNLQTQVTKAVAGDVGRYDFPIFGAPRHFYLSVVDAQGHPLSPTVEIAHGLGAAAQATCHWADWVQR